MCREIRRRRPSRHSVCVQVSSLQKRLQETNTENDKLRAKLKALNEELSATKDEV